MAVDFTSVDRVISKFHRDLKNADLNEGSAIEWIAEALDFLKVKGSSEQAVAFIEVKDYQAVIPLRLQSILQVARNQNWSPENKDCVCPTTMTTTTTTTTTSTTTTTVTITDPNCATCEDKNPKVNQPVPLDCQGKPMTDYDLAYYRPYFDLQSTYFGWTNSEQYYNNYTPVRLADHTFFADTVCRETNHKNIYQSCTDEYTVVGHGADRQLRFSFKEGSVAVAFQRTVIDKETGYPMIPDNISYITAITYYIKWKIAESNDWDGREGWARQSDRAEKRWLKYCRQAKNWMKMPKTLDDYQDLLEQSHHLIPRLRRYYGYFGNLNSMERRDFNNPSRNH